MRRWMLLLMILLLPLRGWAGDVMSVEMAWTSTSAKPAAAMPADCPMHTGAQTADSSESADIAQGAGMQECSSCELCVPVAKLPGNDLRLPSAVRHRAPLTPAVSFVSAALAPRAEPPIS